MTKELVEQDRHIHHIIEMGKQANIAIFTVGTVRDEALLFRLGYFDKDETSLLKNNRSVTFVHVSLMETGILVVKKLISGQLELS